MPVKKVAYKDHMSTELLGLLDRAESKRMMSAERKKIIKQESINLRPGHSETPKRIVRLLKVVVII
jgi:hypothetical protein